MKDTKKSAHTWLAAGAAAGMLSVPFIMDGTAAAQSIPAPYKAYQVTGTWNNVGPTPHFAGIDMRLHKLFVSNLSNGTVTVVNTTTGKPITTIKIGGTLHTVMIDQKTSTVYVTDIQQGYVDVINAKTDTLEHQIVVGGHPHGLAVSQRLHEAFVSNVSLSEVEVINLRTNKVIKTIPVGPNPWGVSVNPVTDTIYSANTGIDPFASTPSAQTNANGDTVTVINGKTFQVEATVPVGPHPWNVIADPVNDTVYVGVSGAAQVAVLHNNQVIKDIPVGQSPHGMALDLPKHEIFVNDSVSDQVSLINTRTNKVTQTLRVGIQPQGVAINTHTGTAYVVNQGSQTVTVLAPGKTTVKG